MKSFILADRTEGKDEWYTPPELVEALGPFDLDPCAARSHIHSCVNWNFFIEDDGLAQKWKGLVFCNPPYSNSEPWLARMVEHGNGILLVPARTDTKRFHRYIFQEATAILFLKGRIRFIPGDGYPSTQPVAPSCLVAYGDGAYNRLIRMKDRGSIMVSVKKTQIPHAKTKGDKNDMHGEENESGQMSGM